MSLNPKQQRFVDEYLKDLNATQAAIRAGYSKKTAKAQGSKQLTKVDIKKAIKASQKAISERAEITQELVIEKLQDIAEANGKNSVAVRCWELIGKHIGMFAERIKIDDLPTIKIEWANESKGHNGHDAGDAPVAVGDIQQPDAV